MADLEAVLADVSYLIAMEKSKTAPTASVTKKIILPDKSVSSVIIRYLKQKKQYNFRDIFNQRLGFLLFKEFCHSAFNEPLLEILFYEDILEFEKVESKAGRVHAAKKVYDKHIMPELLAHDFKFSESAADELQRKISAATLPNHYINQSKPTEAGQSECSNHLSSNLFECFKRELEEYFEKNVFDQFLKSDKFIRFTQWIYFQLNMQLTMSDFSVHRIIGRGGFGEVYGCRKADTGKMYAMKCLDKKRIKMKQGESLALNERNILYAASIGATNDKLCFTLDLMNGGDLHYHLTQHGTFSEQEVKFYAAEITLGLEHMHSRFIVYRDLKPANVLLDERGHVRISDLGLACDFSLKRPQASVGTHGYMAPEVQTKGISYDSTADWFSLGCLMFKLLRGHSPFRMQQKQNKAEYDQTIRELLKECRDTMTNDLCSLLAGLLTCDPAKRLGNRGAKDVKSHQFFNLNWQHVGMQLLLPPIIPPKGEVNAADAFDIGNFDEDDTKGIKLSEADQQQYSDFFIIIVERWQQEVAESIFDTVNVEADRMEAKKSKNSRFKHAMPLEDLTSDLILQGFVRKGNEGSFGYGWQLRYAKLYPNRIELYSDRNERNTEVYTMENISSIEAKEFMTKSNVQQRVVILHTNRPGLFTVSSHSNNTQATLAMIGASASNITQVCEDVLLLFQDEISFDQWRDALEEAKNISTEQIISSGRAFKIY